VTDHLSDLLFTTEESGGRNLAREGISGDKIHFAGNCMVDTLLAHVGRATGLEPWREFDLEPGAYGLVTLHRPSNVDDPATLSTVISGLHQIARQLPLLFPVHPRTRARLEAGRIEMPPGLMATGPLSYLQFLGLMAKARCVLTDSGGIQEETTALGVPCLTIRQNTERPVTLTQGTNRLVGTDPARLCAGFRAVMQSPMPPRGLPPLWDGRAGERVVGVLESWRASRA
jgi:UDP-N-acetylglucosamine 2-epimerase (non-hydrolysing)